jgi:hypothetical protein
MATDGGADGVTEGVAELEAAGVPLAPADAEADADADGAAETDGTGVGVGFAVRRPP